MNATGWTELMDGKLIQSAWSMYHGALGSWLFMVLFGIFQLLLWAKTKSPLLAVITTVFVLATDYVRSFLAPMIKTFLFVYLVINIALILWGLVRGYKR